MALMNRLANSNNRFQGPFKRVLTVCSAGLLRSPTIAFVLSQEPFGCNVRAAGASQEYALIPIDQVLLTWADEVVCAEEEHKDMILEFLKDNDLQDEFEDLKITVLGVPDCFPFRDSALIDLIKERLKAVDFKGTFQ